MPNREPREPFGRKPWLRQPREPQAAYARFIAYRDLGTSRSLAAAAPLCGLSLGRLKQLSGGWRWSRRAQAWDRDQFLKRRNQQLEACEESRERLRRESADWQKVASLEFRSWVRRDERGELQLVRELSPTEAIRLWQVGSRALLQLQEAAATPLEEADAERSRRFQNGMQDAIQAATDYLCRRLSWEYKVPMRGAVSRAIDAWCDQWQRSHPPEESAIDAGVWPWDQPLEQA